MPKISKEVSAWFDYPDDPLGGKVEVRHLKKAKAQGILGQAMDQKVISRGKDASGEPLVESEIKVDNVKTNELLAVACVKAWENFQDEKGEVLPCNKDNIKRYAGEDGFIEFLVKCREDLAKQVKEQQEKALKN